MTGPRGVGDPGADRFTGDGPLDVSFLEVEHEDRQAVIETHADGGHVHHLQVFAEDLIIFELIIANGVGLLGSAE